MDGYQLCQKLRQRSSIEMVPFIFITPPGEFPDKLMGHETFASDYVQRPINIDEFEQRLKGVLFVWPPANLTTGQSVDEIFAEFNIKLRGANESRLKPNPRVGMIRPDYLDQQRIGEKAVMVYKEVADFLRASFRYAEVDEPVDVLKGREIVNHIVDLLQNDNDLLLLATDRTSEFSLTQHSLNVAIIGSSIAQNRGMPEERIMRTCLAGMLHDIGTVKLPKRLIYKPAVLSASERAEMQRRPIYSAQILSASQGFNWLPEIVSQVYEREDGTGYPYGLDGKQISDEGKVLGISDVLEACIHHRPYRRAAGE
jgi:HD-GYP domain-containing protein (c-di-GMP phosphodiesterase class II)